MRVLISVLSVAIWESFGLVLRILFLMFILSVMLRGNDAPLKGRRPFGMKCLSAVRMRFCSVELALWMLLRGSVGMLDSMCSVNAVQLAFL